MPSLSSGEVLLAIAIDLNPRKQHNFLLWQPSTSSILHVYTSHWLSQRHHSALPPLSPSLSSSSILLASLLSLCSLHPPSRFKPEAHTPTYTINAPNPNSPRNHHRASRLCSLALDRTVAPSGVPTVSRRRLNPQASSSSAPSSSATPTPTRIIYRESRPKSDYPFWQQNWFIVLLFVMAIGFFGFALFLFLGLDFDQGSPSPAYGASSEGAEITYGSVLKLMHEKTKYRLHSHDVPYGSGSGQQSVTGFSGVDDANSYWIVRPQPGTSAKQGDPIKSGAIIKLQHMRTRKWLHSHLHASPITGNLEVSCFGGETESDTGDYWRLMIEGTGKTWKQEQRIRLQHVDTSGYLHSHDKKYQRIAGGQQEVCGVREKRPDNIWLAAEGVYLPVTQSK